MTTIVNKYHKVPYDIYIGRGSIYGNPFVIGEDGNRDEVIEKYKEYLYQRCLEEPDFKTEILKLKGKILCCFCFPKRCHGDVIIEYLKEQNEQNKLF